MIELTGHVYEANKVDSLESVAYDIYKEADNWGYNYNMEVHYRGVIIHLDWDIFSLCEFSKEGIVNHIIDRYKESV